MTDSTEQTVEWVPGAADRDEPELARAGRMLLAHKIDKHVEELMICSGEILDRAYAGEDITRDDVRTLRSSIDALEYNLDEFVEPILDEIEAESNSPKA